jgi:hypothetical protein
MCEHDFPSFSAGKESMADAAAQATMSLAGPNEASNVDAARPRDRPCLHDLKEITGSLAGRSGNDPHAMALH